MRKSRVLLAALAGMTIASPVFAADIPLKAPAAVPAVSTWNGWYIGGEFGGKWVTDDWDTTCVQGGGIGAAAALCGNALNALVFPGAPDATRSHSFTTSGFRPGVYAGAMFQAYSNWVFGIEGDYGFYNQSSTVQGILGCSTAACSPLLTPSTPANDFTTVKNGDDFSLRVRAGFLVTPDILLYATGGAAAQRVEATLSCNGATSPVCNFSQFQTDSTWLAGWTVGGGLEWKLAQNWLLRGEYRFADFGTWKPNFFVGGGIAEVFADVRVKSQIATAGIAYLFPVPH
ncbi:MAG TPA: outer membrane beta-barrel protein [Xanthobacteraceae bacterium]|nr:outer membrane beta-barrel protein [Xanthobacteraceae bacterium]